MNGAPYSQRRPFRLAGAGLAVLCLAVVSTVLGTTAQVLILHTNDLHDHLRPDAGDVTAKGDLVACRSNYRMNYAALRRNGYNAVTMESHDHAAGLAALHASEQGLGQPLHWLNLTKPDGIPEFTPSRVVAVGPLGVALSGLIMPRPAGGLDFEASGRALAPRAGTPAGPVESWVLTRRGIATIPAVDAGVRATKVCSEASLSGHWRLLRLPFCLDGNGPPARENFYSLVRWPSPCASIIKPQLITPYIE